MSRASAIAGLISDLQSSDHEVAAQAWAETAELRSVLWRTQQALTAQVRQTGPISTPSGVVEIEPNGWEYDGARVAELNPALVKEVVVTLGLRDDGEAGRAVDLLLEELPDARVVEVTRKVDTTAFNRAVRVADPELRERLDSCRSSRGRLAVRPR